MTRPDSFFWKNAAKQLIRETVWLSLSSHNKNPSKKDICLYASRRGGSTFVQQVIGGDPGILTHNQPFCVQSVGNNFFKTLPVREAGEITSIDDLSRDRLKAHMDNIISGRYRVDSPWRFWQADFHFRTDRALLKINTAKAIIDWIADNYDVHTVYLTRHPIPQSLSVMHNDWGHTAPAYLRDPLFVERFLDSRMLAYCHDLMKSAEPLARHVLDWALENLVPHRLIADRPDWLWVTYEQAVNQPNTVISALARHCGLVEPERMARQAMRPSRSSSLSNSASLKESIRVSATGDLTGRWRKQVDSEAEKVLMAILENLEIDSYGAGALTALDPRATIADEGGQE